jgi:hypothetical protein
MNKLTTQNKLRIEELIPKEVIDQKDMEFMVEQYIYVLKGCETKIDITKGVPQGGFFNYMMNQQLMKLSEAYFVALGFFGENIDQL